MNRIQIFRNNLNDKLRANNYRLAYSLAAYSIYIGYASFIGLIASIDGKSIYPLIHGFLFGSVFGIIVGTLAFIKHPVSKDWGPPLNLVV